MEMKKHTSIDYFILKNTEILINHWTQVKKNPEFSQVLFDTMSIFSITVQTHLMAFAFLLLFKTLSIIINSSSNEIISHKV